MGVVVNHCVFAFLCVKKGTAIPINGLYQEKVLLDAIKQHKSWIRNLAPSLKAYYMNVEGKPYKHGAHCQYPIRAFIFNVWSSRFLGEQGPKELENTCLMIANHIADNLSNVYVPQNAAELMFTHDAVFSDFIGPNKAAERLIETYGNPDEEWFDKNVENIHAYFRKGKIPPNIGAALCAPDDEMDFIVVE